MAEPDPKAPESYRYGEREVPEMGARQVRFGEGRFSAYVAFTLGALSVLAVLCFRFPEYLTTPDLREAYDVDLLRNLLRASMTASLALGAFAFARSRDAKRFAALGLLLTGLAVAMGGYHVQGRAVRHETLFLGVDWFVLDLLGSALLFIVIEKLWPKYREQAVLRPEWGIDLTYFAINHFLVGVIMIVVNGFAPRAFGWAVNDSLRAWVQSLPFALEVLLLMLAADFVQYWVHRAFHEIPFLWPVHAVHHSTEHMDWVAGSRMHLVQELVDRSLVMVPLYLLGPSTRALDAYVIVAALQAVFVHANVGFRFGVLRYLLVTPQFHHWHHSKDRPAIDTNYAVHMPVWDALFGTFHLPGDHWPKEYGTVHALPKSLGGQFLYPFRARR
jgi:lathosterol oxidase